MSKRVPRRDTSVSTMVDDHSRKVYAVSNSTRTVHVYGRTADDARDTCDVHGYLADDGTDWEVIQVYSGDPGVGDAYAEADRRFDRLHAAA